MSSLSSAPESDELVVAALGKGLVVVQHVGDSAAHAGAEVPPGAAEHDDGAARHVLAAVIAEPSTTAVAPELRTAKRSPTRPRKNALPAVAP